MTTTLDTAPADFEQKLDALAAEVAFLAAEARLARRRRERWEELQHDVMPIASDALEVVGRELDDLDIDVAEIGALLRRLVHMAPTIDRLLGQLEMYSELAGDIVPIAGEAMEAATSGLATLDQRGYFAFARGAVQVVDQVVTGFTEDDIAQLGDNVVLILNTIKGLTQPEVMAALQRMIGAVQDQQRRIAAEPVEPPSLFQIARQLRDPEVRRGIARGLDTLRAVSEAENSETAKIQPRTTGGN